MNKDFNELQEEQPQPVIKNEEGLAKKLYRLRMLKAEQAAEDERYNREIEESNAWYRPSKQQRQEQIDYVTSIIEEYYQSRFEKNPYYRYKDRNGKVGKKTTTHYKYNNDELIASLPEELVKTTVTVKKADLKKRFRMEKVDGRQVPVTDGNGHPITEDGEIITGVIASEQTEVVVNTTK